MKSLRVELASGQLDVAVEQSVVTLKDMCGFASRRSRKRGFVFLSKVLGKHWPVRPSVMLDMHQRLASALPTLQSPVAFIGLAETATALSQGVYQAWCRTRPTSDSLFLHSTRYRLDHPRALRFEESHSHATSHLVYEPRDADLRERFLAARTLVLIDDEISTGRTLAELACAYRRGNPHLQEVVLVCLTDWMGEENRTWLRAEIDLPTHFVSLLRGTFRFEPNERFEPGSIPNVDSRSEFKDAILPKHHARLGLSGESYFDESLQDRLAFTRRLPRGPVLVLGTGEFAYPPFQFALALEERGWDVRYQSTTRSPLMVGNDITSAFEFVDNYHDEIPNYVYNATDREYEHIVVGYETRRLPTSHRLCEDLEATPLFFD